MNATAAVQTRNGNGHRPRFEDLSIARIAIKCNLDKATTRQRLEKYGYSPVSEAVNLKLYRFDAEMESRLTETSDELGQVRIRKETAAARKIELQVAEAEGELASVAEFTDIVQRLFGGTYKETIRMIKRWAPRLVKMKTPAEAEKFMMTEYQKFANSLRSDFQKFITKK